MARRPHLAKITQHFHLKRVSQKYKIVFPIMFEKIGKPKPVKY